MPGVTVQQTAAIQVSVSPGLGASIVVDGTSTAIVGTAGINPFIAGDNITITTTGGGITVFGRDPPVLSVQGQTGVVTLSRADLGAAAVLHTHSTSDVEGFATAAAAASPVQSVAGRTGSVVLTTSDVSMFAAEASLAAPVQGVAGRTGNVTLTTSDISMFTAAAAIASPVQSVAGRTGNVTLVTSDISMFSISAASVAPVQAVAGRTGNVTLTIADVSAADASHGHPYVTSLNQATGSVSIVAGGNVSVATDGTAITISAAANTNAVVASLWPAFILGG